MAGDLRQVPNLRLFQNELALDLPGDAADTLHTLFCADCRNLTPPWPKLRDTISPNLVRCCERKWLYEPRKY